MDKYWLILATAYWALALCRALCWQLSSDGLRIQSWTFACKAHVPNCCVLKSSAPEELYLVFPATFPEGFWKVIILAFNYWMSTMPVNVLGSFFVVRRWDNTKENSSLAPFCRCRNWDDSWKWKNLFKVTRRLDSSAWFIHRLCSCCCNILEMFREVLNVWGQETRLCTEKTGYGCSQWSTRRKTFKYLLSRRRRIRHLVLLWKTNVSLINDPDSEITMAVACTSEFYLIKSRNWVYNLKLLKIKFEPC